MLVPVNARTSDNITYILLILLIFSEDKKECWRVGTLLKSPSTSGNINTSGNDTSLDVLD